MDIPSEIVEAVKQTKADLVEPKRKFSKHDKQKRILNALGNGLRTTESIANATNLDQKQVGRALFTLMRKGLAFVVKKKGVQHRKYYLNTEKPSLDKGEIAIQKRTHVKTAKSVVESKLAKATALNDKNNEDMNHMAGELVARQNKLNEISQKLGEMTSKLAFLEQALTEKDKEIWTLECEIFDKKAIINYLEGKLIVKGGVI